MYSDNSRADPSSQTRRSLLASAGVSGVAALAGCLARDGDSSFTPPSFPTTEGSRYATWIPAERDVQSTIEACSPAASLAETSQSVITRQLNIIKFIDLSYGLDLSTVDHVVHDFTKIIATGSIDTEAVGQRMVGQLPYETAGSYGEFTMYRRTDSQEQTVALGRDTAISDTSHYDYDETHNERTSHMESIIDTKFGSEPNIVQSDDAFEAAANGIGDSIHGTSFSTPREDDYDSPVVPERVAEVRRATDNYGYQIRQAAFATGVDDGDIEEFAAETGAAYPSEVETTYTIDEVSGYPSLRQYARIDRERALETANVQSLPDIAFRVEESAETVTLTHEYGEAVNAENLELEGSGDATDGAVPLEIQPSDTYETLDRGSTLEVSKQFEGEPLFRIYLSYTAGSQRYDTICQYAPEQE